MGSLTHPPRHFEEIITILFKHGFKLELDPVKFYPQVQMKLSDSKNIEFTQAMPQDHFSISEFLHCLEFCIDKLCNGFGEPAEEPTDILGEKPWGIMDDFYTVENNRIRKYTIKKILIRFGFKTIYYPSQDSSKAFEEGQMFRTPHLLMAKMAEDWEMEKKEQEQKGSKAKLKSKKPLPIVDDEDEDDDE